MKLDHWMIIIAFLGVVFGLAFLFMPAQMMDIYGLSSNEALLHMTRMFGSAILGLGGLSWMAKGLSESRALRANVLALLIYFTFGSVSLLYFGLQGLANFMMWFTLGFHVPIVIALGYFLFARKWSFSDCDTIEKLDQAG